MNTIVKRIGIGVGITLAIVGILSGAGYVYLRNSEWWTAFSLFSDETRVENFRNFHNLFPAEEFRTGNQLWDFERLSLSLPEFYEFEGTQKDIRGFLDTTWTTGLVVARGEHILSEEYFLGYQEDSLATSFSVAKSIISGLVGIAIDRGYIQSVDDQVEAYLSEFLGTDYGKVTIRDLLTMSSGLGFDEDYESFTSDINFLPIRVFGLRQRLPDLLTSLTKVRDPGIYNEYLSSDTLVLGLILQEVSGKSVSQFLEEAIWIPVGMEFHGYWNTDTHGYTLTHGFLSATLRDFLRFGRIYANNGRANGVQIIPEDWIQESVYRPEPRLQPGENPLSDWTFGYGYQWWVPEHPQGDFTAIGIWGQYIYIYPELDVVIVKTSADYDFDQRDHETIALFRTLAQWAADQDEVQ